MLHLHTLGRLWIDDEGTPVAGELRPRRLALLAIVASAGAKGISRDQVLPVFWADSEPEKARHSLSQALYGLRRDLRVDVVLETPNLAIDSSKLTADVAEFRAAIAEKNWERAAEVYAGPFLDGFYLSDAPQFERWVEEERTVLARDAKRALEQVAARADSQGDRDAAGAAWERLTVLDPLNGRYAVRHMEALLATGDRLAALKHGQIHADLLRSELETEPDADLVALLVKLRDAGTKTPVAPPMVRGPVGVSVEGAARVSGRIPVVSPPPRRRRNALVAAGLVVAAIALGAILRKTDDTATVVSASTERGNSALAQRLFESGLQAYFQFDPQAADRLFSASLKEDPDFALATYFAWRAETALGGPRQDELASRAVALARTAGEHDRLLITTHLAAARWELRAATLAESLSTKFPDDPDALMRAAEIAPTLADAVKLLERAIAVDSAASSQATAACRACEAFLLLAERYDWADSLRGVEETLDRWTRFRPADHQSWQRRADYLVSLGRKRDASSAARRADSLGAPRANSPMAALELNLRLDEFDAVSERCRDRLNLAGPDELPRYRWLCAIGLRAMGRYRDALGLIHDGRNPWTGVLRGGLFPDRIHAAVLDAEMGRAGAAADQYLRLASDTASAAPERGRFARNPVWELTLAATAMGLAGDTIRVRSLVDSVEIAGHRSLYGRDPLLHHFLRGLLFASAGQHDAAVAAYRTALWSPTKGYTRIGYELARSLVTLNRPGEAIVVLRGVLRAGVEGSALYLTRTETHELLAQAFAATGQRDSAAAHLAVVERAWRTADPFLAARYDAARQRLLRSGVRPR